MLNALRSFVFTFIFEHQTAHRSRQTTVYLRVIYIFYSKITKAQGGEKRVQVTKYWKQNSNRIVLRPESTKTVYCGHRLDELVFPRLFMGFGSGDLYGPSIRFMFLC
uniref:Secreted protein n=1 Tax=Heterorhabditis bacteriophora TaxID=37862 RepID=A0A1I7X2P9_HETBA